MPAWTSIDKFFSIAWTWSSCKKIAATWQLQSGHGIKLVSLCIWCPCWARLDPSCIFKTQTFNWLRWFSNVTLVYVPFLEHWLLIWHCRSLEVCGTDKKRSQENEEPADIRSDHVTEPWSAPKTQEKVGVNCQLGSLEHLQNKPTSSHWWIQLVANKNHPVVMKRNVSCEADSAMSCEIVPRGKTQAHHRLLYYFSICNLWIFPSGSSFVLLVFTICVFKTYKNLSGINTTTLVRLSCLFQPL